MNFAACKNKNASIIFSTISNFECFYLYMTEKSKENIDDYYRKTVLLVDEADSILIDEITNGTIISRQLNSNCEEVLTHVYNSYIKNDKISASKLHEEIIEQWPNCTDLTEYDVENMLKELKLVLKDPFVDGKKYLIVNTNKKPTTDKSNKIQYKEIVPFDFDNKGIIEKNKEYSGFIEQFITIKELSNRKNRDIIFKDISLNYLYISHPVYVKLYSNVFGLTGTIGKSYEKKLLEKHYKLNSIKMPKEFPKRYCHFPIKLCEEKSQRNKLIVDEVIGFHEKGFPVLVILFSPNEISEMEELIRKHPKFNEGQTIRIYQGNDIKIKPNNDSGKEGAISLGTNVCGRGTHIEVGKKHLHVIISFYTSNNRALHQAFGRTARKNNFGSVHIICLKSEFNNGTRMIDDNEVESNLTKMEIYKNMQKKFIDEFRNKREWIFETNLNYVKKFSYDELKKLRIPKINVNRVKAYEYQYPICMNHSTFIDIQTQKIFSLLNCPNCIYTWQLFQRYIREMILQSWSILINKEDKLFNSDSTSIDDIRSHLDQQSRKLINELRVYLPNDDKKTDIFQNFLHIFNLVYNKYSFIRIIQILPKKRNKEIQVDSDDCSEKSFFKKVKSNISSRFSRISLEFRPFSLVYKSGSRIRELMDKEPEISYIEDPELKYKRKKDDQLFSITNVLDTIFEKIWIIFNDFLEKHLNFKLFLRRTLAGCEFGICYDFEVENIDEKVREWKNCLFDKDPLFVFCIYVNSTLPFLAGVLIFFIVYLISVINNLINFSKTIIKGFSVSGLKLFEALSTTFGEKLFDEAKGSVCGKITEYLESKIMELMEKFKSTKYERFYYIISMLTKILTGKTVDDTFEYGEELVSKISEKFNKLDEKKKKRINPLFKIGFLCVLWLISHMLNFQINFIFNNKLKYDSKIGNDSEYLKKHHDNDTVERLIEKNKNIVILESEKLKIDLNIDLEKIFKNNK